MGPARQVALIDDVRAELDGAASTTDAGLSAMDETNPGIFATNWAGYPTATRQKVDRMNVHTYGVTGRLNIVVDDRQVATTDHRVDRAREYEPVDTVPLAAGRHRVSIRYDEELLADVQRGVDAANENLAHVEGVKRFKILPVPWDPGGDELTPTMKLKRRPIADKYVDEIDALYAD